MFQFLRKTFLWVLAVPVLSMVLGAASNQAVLWANHDTFPVRINLLKAYEWTDSGTKAVPMPAIPEAGIDATFMLDDIHCLMTNKTHLNWLADNFDFHDTIESVGDLMLDFGEWTWGYAPVVWAILALQAFTKKEDYGSVNASHQ